MQLEITRQDKALSAILTGRFAYPDNGPFKEIYIEAEHGGVEHISLNLTRVDFIDSTSLGMLMLLHHFAKKKGVAVTLHGARGQVDKVLRTSKFDELFTMVA